MQKYNFQNRETVFHQFALEIMLVVWKEEMFFGFNFVLNLNNYRSGVGQHFLGSFHYFHKCLQTVEAGYDQDNLLFSLRMDEVNLWFFTGLVRIWQFGRR